MYGVPRERKRNEMLNCLCMKDKRVKLMVVCIVGIILLIVMIILTVMFLPGPGGKDKPTSATDRKRQASINGYAASAKLHLYKSWFKGDATYYESPGEGTCQIAKDNLPPAARNSKYLAALNVKQFMKSAACGMCFRVKGNGTGFGDDPITGDFIVFIKDLCPECEEGDVALAIDGHGRWDIEIQAVQCPVGFTFIQYSFQGSDGFYLKLQVRNTRIPPQRVEVKDLTGFWIDMNQSTDGHWVGSSHFDEMGGIPVRLTSITGNRLEDAIPQLVNKVVMEGEKSAQFPLDYSLLTS